MKETKTEVETLQLQLQLFTARALNVGLSLNEVGQAVEREIIQQSLSRGDSILRTAKTLGLHRNTLSRKMRSLSVGKPKKSDLKKRPAPAPKPAETPAKTA